MYIHRQFLHPMDSQHLVSHIPNCQYYLSAVFLNSRAARVGLLRLLYCKQDENSAHACSFKHGVSNDISVHLRYYQASYPNKPSVADRHRHFSEASSWQQLALGLALLVGVYTILFDVALLTEMTGRMAWMLRTTRPVLPGHPVQLMEDRDQQVSRSPVQSPTPKPIFKLARQGFLNAFESGILLQMCSIIPASRTNTSTKRRYSTIPHPPTRIPERQNGSKNQAIETGRRPWIPLACRHRLIPPENIPSTITLPQQ